MNRYLITRFILIMGIGLILPYCSSKSEGKSTQTDYELSKADDYLKEGSGSENQNSLSDAIDLKTEVHYLYERVQPIDLVMLWSEYETLVAKLQAQGYTENLLYRVIRLSESYLEAGVIEARRKNLDLNYLFFTDLPTVASLQNVYSELSTLIINDKGLENVKWSYMNPFQDVLESSNNSSITSLNSMLSETSDYPCIIKQVSKEIQWELSPPYRISDMINLNLSSQKDIFFLQLPVRLSKEASVLMFNEIVGNEFKGKGIKYLLSENIDVLLAKNMEEVLNQFIEEMFISTQRFNLTIPTKQVVGIKAVNELDGGQEANLPSSAYAFYPERNEIQIIVKIPLNTRFEVQILPQ